MWIDMYICGLKCKFMASYNNWIWLHDIANIIVWKIYLKVAMGKLRGNG